MNGHERRAEQRLRHDEYRDRGLPSLPGWPGAGHGSLADAGDVPVNSNDPADTMERVRAMAFQQGGTMGTSDLIRQFIGAELSAEHREPIADSEPLIEQGIIDSLGIIRLLGFIEERFSVKIEGDELIPENFASIAAISSLVERKQVSAAGD